MSALPLCAESARERQDPMLGTALTMSRFLLVEHPGPWAFHALDGSGIDADVLARIVAVNRDVGGRTLLVRRPGRQEPAPTRRWAVADVRAGRIRWGNWERDEDLLEACATLREPSEDWPDEPVVLVCAHGRHDTCCAVRGRPVAAALAQEHPELVWECTHVGGDRFAANVVVLPDGTYYGGVDDDDAVAVVRRHLAGTVTPERMRGTSLLPPVAQAAAVAAHGRWGPGAPRDVRAAHVVGEGEGRWRVVLEAGGALPDRIEAHVQARQAPAARLTCQAPRDTTARVLEVTSVQDVSTGAPAPPP